jgi:hypothetical protein
VEYAISVANFTITAVAEDQNDQPNQFWKDSEQGLSLLCTAFDLARWMQGHARSL